MHKEARDVTAAGERYRLVRAEVILHKIGDQAPYFSVTGEAWYAGSHRRDPDACGAIHDLLGEVFPDLADVIALHLSDVDGVPMHAEANGWYWFSDYEGRGGTHPPEHWRDLTGAQRAERYLRAPIGHFDSVWEHTSADTKWSELRPAFTAKVEELRPQWKREAKAAIERYSLTVVRPS